MKLFRGWLDTRCWCLHINGLQTNEEYNCFRFLGYLHLPPINDASFIAGGVTVQEHL